MYVTLDDGCQLFYKVDDFTDPWEEPETVVLHHGMAKNHKLWYAWIPIIARHFRVVRFDMRGMGQSSVPEPGYPWSVDNFAADLKQLLDKLELERVHLVGETVGGSISMRFATMHQDRLISLTACTSPTSFDDPHHAESADLIEREGVAAWVENTIGRRLDPQIVPPRIHPLVCCPNVGYPRPRGWRLSAQRRRRPSAPAFGSPHANIDPGCRQPAGRGFGRFSGRCRPLTQRQKSGVSPVFMALSSTYCRSLAPGSGWNLPGKCRSA